MASHIDLDVDPSARVQMNTTRLSTGSADEVAAVQAAHARATASAAAIWEDDASKPNDSDLFDRACCDGEWSICKTFVNLYAAFTIWYGSLVNMETLMACAVGAGATIGLWYGGDKGERISSNMNWSLVSLALVFPLVYSIGQAFRRREEALDDIADVKALVCNQLLAHVGWEFSAAGTAPKAAWYGRQYLPEGFNERTHANLVGLVTAMEEYLSLPMVSRGRHRVTSAGMALKTKVQGLKGYYMDQFTRSLHRTTRTIESLKTRGMPGNEAARLNQYLWLTQSRFEKLRRVKEYRTPQAVRSFARVYILILPVFYAPYYVYLAGEGNSAGGIGLPFAVTLSVLTSAVMTTLFNVEHALEDPFDERGLDSIHVRDEFEELKHNLALIFQCQIKCDTGPCVIMDGPQAQSGVGGGPIVAAGGSGAKL